MDKKSPRILTLFSDVNEGSCLSLIVSLLKLDAESHEPIHLYIDSSGGDIDEGLALYDVIRHIESPVYTLVVGKAASMGAFLLSIGEKGHRYALPHARILIHQPLISTRDGASLPQSRFAQIAKSLQESRANLEAIMAKATGQEISKFHHDCERDNWMSAQEALAYGLIDQIVSPTR